MATTYNWNVSQLERKISSGFVTIAHWQATAKDGNYFASMPGICSWADGIPTIPYSNLTKENVFDWIWANGVDKTVIEAILQTQIDAQKNPITVTGVPW
jgi:hypothetical protein